MISFHKVNQAFSLCIIPFERCIGVTTQYELMSFVHVNKNLNIIQSGLIFSVAYIDEPIIARHIQKNYNYIDITITSYLHSTNPPIINI